MSHCILQMARVGFFYLIRPILKTSQSLLKTPWVVRSKSMHHIYHTEGIILGSKNFGEAGKYFYIFTRDLGMVTASAQGVRKMSSKLRFILQDFSYTKIDLVSGRNIFRVTSASKVNMLEDITKNPGAIRVFANISRLLKRLLAGVEPN